MHSSTSNSSFLQKLINRRTLVTFLVTGILLAVVGFSVQTHSDVVPGIFFANKAQAKAVYDIVLVGDSRVYRGLSPVHMGSILKDHDALNFGFSSGGFSPLLMEAAEAKLDADDVPNVIVLGITPHSLTPEALANKHYFKSLHAPYNRLQFWFTSITQPMESFFQPVDFDQLMERMKPDGKPEWIYQQKWDQYGWVASDRLPHNPEYAVASYRNVFADNQVDDEAVLTLMTQVEEWTEEGICVIAFRFPATSGMIEIEEELSAFQETEVAQSFTDAGGLWLDLDYRDYQSYDGSHLSKNSAIELSYDVAEFILDSGCVD